MKTMPNAVNVWISPVNTNAGTALNIEAYVNDAQVRQTAPGFDGMEKVFALVPLRRASGEQVWQRFNLNYTSSLGGPVGQGPDRHYAFVSSTEFDPTAQLDFSSIYGAGIALGMDTNVGTLWLQTPGDGFKPV